MKAQPGKISVATAGVTSAGHNAMELIAKVTGVKYRHVTYDGGNPAVVATVAGEAEVTTQLAVEQADMIRGKRLRPLATVSDKPLELEGYGTIPPLSQTLPGFTAPANYFGIFIPKGVPDDVVKTRREDLDRDHLQERGAEEVRDQPRRAVRTRRRARPRRRRCSRRCRPTPGCCSTAARPRSRPTPSASRSPERATTDVVARDRRLRRPDAERGARRRAQRLALAALGWMALGIAVLIGSITMDRLEQQNINPYTVPGLLPGLLGIAMIAAGRAARRCAAGGRGALSHPAAAAARRPRASRRAARAGASRCASPIGVVLVGHGLPFWLGVGDLRHRLHPLAAAAAARSAGAPADAARRRRSRSRSASAPALAHHLRVPGTLPGAPALSRDLTHARRVSPTSANAWLSFLNPTSLALRASAARCSASSSASCPACRRRSRIALLTTLTIKLPANDAILVLICSYVGALYGGSRTAILLNIPGTAANAASCADGYALALRGEAGRAIGIATSGAFIGTLFGVLCLAAFTPLLAEVALSFGAFEFFWLALFGVAMSGSIVGNDPLKGWLMGALGLFVAQIGQEGLYAYDRFTFGWDELAGGIALIPALVGAFGLAEVLTTLADPVETQDGRAEGLGAAALSRGRSSTGAPCCARA